MHIYLNTLVNLILSTYFQNSRCLLVFNDNNNYVYTGELPWVHIRVINATFDSNLIFDKHYGCQGILINTKHPVSTMRLMENGIRYNMDRFNTRRYLFLPTDGAEEDLMDVFGTKEIEFIADLLVIVQNFENDFADLWFSLPKVKYEMYTHRFVGLNNTNEVVLLDQWHSSNKSFERNADLYPDKLSDGQGRAFTVATFSYKPYSVPATLEGTELEISIAFCQKYNLTATLYVDEVGEWGEIYDNWTGYGILGNVMMDYGDVGLAALYTWAHEYFFLDLSKPVVRTGITCIAPAPTLASGWLVPMFSFSYKMWAGVGLSFVGSALALFIFDYIRIRSESQKQNPPAEVDKLQILENSVFRTTSIFLIQSLNNQNDLRELVKKYIYGCMFLFSLLIASSYSSGLASSMTVPRYVGAIKTVQDLVDSEIHWGATSIAWIMSIMEAPERNYVLLVERFLKAEAEELIKHNGERFAFSVERLPAGYFAIGEYVTEEGVQHLRLMTEDLYWEQCVLMTKKSSIWMPNLDHFILLVAQTGIQSVWEFRVATTHMNSKIQRAVKYSSHHESGDGEPIKLRLGHVQGAFGMLIIGIMFATVVFALEQVCWKKQDVKVENEYQDVSALHNEEIETDYL